MLAPPAARKDKHIQAAAGHRLTCRILVDCLGDLYRFTPVAEVSSMTMRR